MRPPARVVMAIAALLALASSALADQPGPPPPPTSPPFGEGGDIKCNCDQKQETTPVRAFKNCSATPPSGGNGLACAPPIILAPQCPAIDGDTTLNGMYNLFILSAQPYLVKPFDASAMDRDVVGYADGIPQDPQDHRAGTAAHIINTYLKPFNAGHLKIVVWNAEYPYDAFVDLQAFSAEPPTKVSLFIREGAFYKYSVPALASTIGHELVHTLQYKRRYSLTDAQKDSIKDAINHLEELEPRYWQQGHASSVWPSPFSGKGKALYACQRPMEKFIINQAVLCGEWLVAHDIHEMASSWFFGGVKIHNLDLWLHENDWAADAWLPEHPNWKHGADPGPPPYPECLN